MAVVLGTFEQAVLMAVLKLRDEAYGRSILRALADSLGRTVAAGAVYSTLDRLQEKGLLTSQLGEGTPIRDGRARRYFNINAAGIAALNAGRAAMDQIWAGTAWPLRGRA